MYLKVNVFGNFLENAKHRANDASNDVNRPPLGQVGGVFGCPGQTLLIWLFANVVRWQTEIIQPALKQPLSLENGTILRNVYAIMQVQIFDDLKVTGSAHINPKYFFHC